MISAGKLIWLSCRPLLRLILSVASGFTIGKADMLPPVAKIVPAFTSDNVSALGPLVFVAFLYQALGLALAFLVKQLFWVPHRFRYGILVTGGWGNVADIPTAIVLSIAASPPFGNANDQDLVIAYISAFVLVSTVTLFPFGGHKLVAWDFQGPDVANEEVRKNMRRKWNVLLKLSRKLLRGRKKSLHGEDNNPAVIEGVETPISGTDEEKCFDVNSGAHQRQKPDSLADLNPSTVIANGEKVNYDTLDRSPDSLDKRSTTPVDSNSDTVTAEGPLPKIREFMKALLTPTSVAILISLIIAFVPKLKALFVPVPGTYMHPAPDGLPPLNIILDTTTFLGAATVPLGLISLGSSLARLNVPKRGEWKDLPMGAIAGIAIIRMVIMPVLGVVICEGLLNVGIISRGDKLLRFVCIFFSCLPTATAQILLTQVYSGTGSADHVSFFLIPQYFLMFLAMPALTAYTIQLIF